MKIKIEKVQFENMINSSLELCVYLKLDYVEYREYGISKGCLYVHESGNITKFENEKSSKYRYLYGEYIEDKKLLEYIKNTIQKHLKCDIDAITTFLAIYYDKAYPLFLEEIGEKEKEI